MQRAPYLGDTGHARATNEAKAQIKTLDQQHLKDVAKGYNVQIDNRLDAHRENQAGRAPLALKPAAPERGPVAPMRPTREPNRYAVIDRQNYTERANQAETNRKNEQDLTQQQQRQRGPQR
jgi:hypothetical protein